jgi:tetratricopeptide (TPR) repeat protein
MAKDHNGLAQGLAGLAQISRDSDDGTGARRHYEEAVAIYRVLHDDLKLAHTIRHLADILRHQGDNVLAESCYAEALHIYRQSESTVPLDLANTIRGYALLKGNCGETEVAIGLWREAKSLYASLKVQDGVDESDQYLSRLTQA